MTTNNNCETYCGLLMVYKPSGNIVIYSLNDDDLLCGLSVHANRSQAVKWIERYTDCMEADLIAESTYEVRV